MTGGREVDGEEVCLWCMIPAKAAAGLCVGLWRDSGCRSAESTLSLWRDAIAGASRAEVADTSSTKSI